MVVAVVVAVVVPLLAVAADVAAVATVTATGAVAAAPTNTAALAGLRTAVAGLDHTLVAAVPIAIALGSVDVAPSVAVLESTASPVCKI